MPGRAHDGANRRTELRTTLVLRLPIVEASAKVRTGGPTDDEEDLTLPIWAGVLPIGTTFGPATGEPELAASLPGYVARYARP